MELRQLRYFVAVAEELHFRRAAARLYVSQPPLSQQIRRLEEELGCRLLERTRRRVQLTPAGEAFLHDARALLAELERAIHTARQIEAGQRGRLRVTFVGSALFSIVPAAVQHFRAQRPQVEIQLRERASAEQLRAVAEGAADLGLIRPPAELTEQLRFQPVASEPTIAALPAGHPLVALRRIPLRRLAEQPLVLFPRAQAPGYHDLLTSTLAASGAHPRVVQYAPEMLTIIGLVAAGLGLTLAPASVAHLALPGVVYRPLAGAPKSELVAIARAGERSPLVEAFVQQARLAARQRAAPRPSARPSRREASRAPRGG